MNRYTRSFCWLAIGTLLISGVLVGSGFISAARATTTTGAASTVSKRLPSDVDGVDLIVTYDRSRVARDYRAETASGVGADDPYARERGVGEGLVHLMNENGRRAKRYIVPRALVRAIVRVRYDMAVLDRADLVFTDGKLVVVHTSQSNGGIFVGSDVYELPFATGRILDRRLISSDESLSRMVDAALEVYRASVRIDRSR